MKKTKNPFLKKREHKQHNTQTQVVRVSSESNDEPVLMAGSNFMLIEFDIPLFVFSINGPKQNARWLLKPVSDTDFYALLHGSQYFGLQGS